MKSLAESRLIQVHPWISRRLEHGAAGQAAVWYDSSNICALADTDRHLGHAVNTPEGWVAFDSTRPNRNNDGFLMVGCFLNATTAKFAIELSVGITGAWWNPEEPSTVQ